MNNVILKIFCVLVVLILGLAAIPDVVTNNVNPDITEADRIHDENEFQGSEMDNEDKQSPNIDEPKTRSSGAEVLSATVNLGGTNYLVYTYWSTTPQIAVDQYISPTYDQNRHMASISRVAIYENSKSSENFVTDKELQEAIITAMELKGFRAYKADALDFISDTSVTYHDVWKWISDRADDLYLIVMNELDDTLLADEEDFDEKQIYKMLILKTLDQDGCSPLSQEDFFEASAWYDDIFGILDEFAPDEYEGIKVNDILDYIETAVGTIDSLTEFYDILNSDDEQSDVSVEVAWEGYNLLKDLLIDFSDLEEELEIIPDAFDKILRAIWEVKIVEKYEPELLAIRDYVTNQELKDALLELTDPGYNVLAHFEDALWKQVETTARDLIDDYIVDKAVESNPYIKAAVLGLDIGMVIAKYLIIDWDTVKGHVNVAMKLEEAERGFRKAINIGTGTEANPAGLRQWVDQNPTAERLSAFNVARKLHKMSAAHFYKEAKYAIEGYKLKFGDDLNEAMDECQEAYDYYKENAFYKVPFMESSDEDIETLVSLVKPGAALAIEEITVSPEIPQFREPFDLDVTFKNEGDVNIPSYKIYLTITNQDGTITHTMDSHNDNDGLATGNSETISFDDLIVVNDDFAGFNHIDINYGYKFSSYSQTSSVSKGVKINREPKTPQLISPTIYGSTNPSFEFVAEDPDGDPLYYQLCIVNDTTYSKTCNQKSQPQEWKKSIYNSSELVNFTFPEVLEDGNYKWWVKVIDDTSKWITSDQRRFKIDSVPPTTFHIGDMSDYIPWMDNDWYNSNIELHAHDNGSDIDYTYYKITDHMSNIVTDTTTETRTSPFELITLDGEYDIEYYSVDMAYNVESTKYFYNLKVDKTKPVPHYGITAPINSRSDPYGNSWRYGTNINIELDSTDPSVNSYKSDIRVLAYKVTRNNESYYDYIDYNLTGRYKYFNHPDDGLYEFVFYLMDNAYNSDTVMFTGRLDQNPPSSSLSEANATTGWHNGRPSIISVDEGSGVRYLYSHIVGNRYDNGMNTSVNFWINKTLNSRNTEIEIPLEDGYYEITYYGEDNVGLVESSNIDNVMVDGHAPNTTFVLNETFDYDGWYNKQHPYLTLYLNSTEIGPSGFWFENLTIVDASTGEVKDYFNSTQSNSVYSIDWLLNEDGTYRAFYQATDKAGNKENLSYKLIRVDKTPPSTTYKILEGHHEKPEKSWIGVNFYPVDETSGVKYFKYSINDGNWFTIEFDYWDSDNFTLYLPDDQLYYIDFYTIDFANNNDTIETVVILPELTLTTSDIWMEGGNLYVEVHNIGFVDAHDVTVYLYGVTTLPHYPEVETLLNTTTIPAIRAKRSSIGCFLPREYVGLYNKTKLVIEKNNITLPEYNKNNNEAEKEVIMILSQWRIATKQKIKDAIMMVPYFLCTPIIVSENVELTLENCDLVMIEPCENGIDWTPTQPPTPDKPTICLENGAILRLINSTITAIDDTVQLVLDLVNGELITEGVVVIIGALILIHDLIVSQPIVIDPTPNPQPIAIEPIDDLLNQIAFQIPGLTAEPAPLPFPTGGSIDITPVVGYPGDPTTWVINPAIPVPETGDTTIALETSLKLVDVDVVMVPMSTTSSTLMVCSGTKLFLIDSTVNSTGSFSSGLSKLLGGGEIININSVLFDHIYYDVRLDVCSYSHYLGSGGRTTYNITVNNTGNSTDTYDLFVEPPGNGWSAWLNKSTVTLNPGHSSNVTLSVQAPTLTGSEEIEDLRSNCTVTVISRGDFDKSSNVTIKTTIVDNPYYFNGGNHINQLNSTTMAPGTWSKCTLNITNVNSNVTVFEIYSFDVPSGWALLLKKAGIIVTPGETAEIDVMIKPPTNEGLIDDYYQPTAYILIFIKTEDGEFSAAMIKIHCEYLYTDPVVNIEPFDPIKYLEENVAFFGCRSTDQNGKPVNYRWDFRKSAALIDFVYGGIGDYVFSQTGTYEVTLRVIDNDGGVSYSQKILEILQSGTRSGTQRTEGGALGCNCGS